MWDGVNYPIKYIKEVKTMSLRYGIRFPYMLIPFYQVGFPVLIDQEQLNIDNWFKGIKILQNLRIKLLLNKISFHYWYQVLDEDGYSRMCKKDLNK